MYLCMSRKGYIWTITQKIKKFKKNKKIFL